MQIQSRHIGRARRAVSALAALALAVTTVTLSGALASAAATGQTFQNAAGGQGEDPDIRYIDGYYYYVQATLPDGSGSFDSNTITMRRSPSLATLSSAPLITLWTAGQGGTPVSQVWAPEIVKFGNTWHVYFAAGADAAHRMYAITSSNPVGGYTLAGRLYDAANDVWAIDGHVFQNNGAYFMAYSGWATATNNTQNIYLVGMDSPTHVNTSRTLLSTPTYDWEKSGTPWVNEGPTVVAHNGVIYMTYSASGCWTPDYKLGQLSASAGANLLAASSWAKKATPIFQRDDAAGVYGPGHNGFFTSPDGTEQWMNYHAVPTSAGNCGGERTVRAQSFSWNADGSPALGTPAALSANLRLPSGDPGSNGIVSLPGSKCLDVAGNDTGGTGAVVQVWDCIDTAADQHWTLQPDGSIRTLGLCLDVIGNSTASGALLELWTCNGVGGQKWAPQDDGSLRNPASGLCLDVPGASTVTGTRLQIYGCLGNVNQRIAVPGWAGSIDAPGGKCVDVAGVDATTSGTAVQVWDCAAVSEKWTPGFDNTLRYANKCLDVVSGGTTNGSLVQLWDCNSSGAQVWTRQADGSLKNPQSGRCLDLPSGNTTNGTRLQIYDCNGAAAQKYRVNG